MTKDVVLTVTDVDADLTALEGKLFQVHLLSGNRLRLVPASVHVDSRCPVMIKGERCGDIAGHTGKHCWDRGD